MSYVVRQIICAH